jgi:Protein of unknown function (DUF2909).
MLFKAVVVLMLVLILSSLWTGLVYLVKDEGRSHRTVQALTFRIALSVALFILLMIGAATGLITPHGL